MSKLINIIKTNNVKPMTINKDIVEAFFDFYNRNTFKTYHISKYTDYMAIKYESMVHILYFDYSSCLHLVIDTFKGMGVPYYNMHALDLGGTENFEIKDENLIEMVKVLKK